MFFFSEGAFEFEFQFEFERVVFFARGCRFRFEFELLGGGGKPVRVRIPGGGFGSSSSWSSNSKGCCFFCRGGTVQARVRVREDRETTGGVEFKSESYSKGREMEFKIESIFFRGDEGGGRVRVRVGFVMQNDPYSTPI